jgi:hypothetical protein
MQERFSAPEAPARRTLVFPALSVPIRDEMPEVDMTCSGDIGAKAGRVTGGDVLMSVRPIVGDAAASDRQAGGDRSDHAGR